MRVKKNKLTQATPPDEPYTNIEMRLVCADSIRIRNTGEVITWKPDMFRVYLYMFNQIKGFEASGGKFFQKREKIWKCCGVSRDRLDKILKSILKLGLIKDTGERRTAPGAPRGMVVYTAFRLMDVIGNLEIIFANDDGEPVWNHERASGKEATTTQASSVDEPADQSDDLASESAKPAVGQRDSVAFGDDRSGTDGNHAVKQPEIFDDRGVITEAFINSLTGNAAPYRNANGTLQSFQYVYWVARHTQDERDGVTVRTREEYMAEAQPWHIPPHLLSENETPIYEDDPKF